MKREVVKTPLLFFFFVCVFFVGKSEVESFSRFLVVVVVVVFVGGNNFTFAGFIFFVLSLSLCFSLSVSLSLLRDTSHPQYEQYEYE